MNEMNKLNCKDGKHRSAGPIQRLSGKTNRMLPENSVKETAGTGLSFGSCIREGQNHYRHINLAAMYEQAGCIEIVLRKDSLLTFSINWRHGKRTIPVRRKFYVPVWFYPCSDTAPDKANRFCEWYD